MAVTAFQSEVLKRIARSRLDGGETYIAGGLALNHQLKRPRRSSDIDVFNSSYLGLERAADHDCAVLKDAGYDIRVTRKRDYIVEVVVSKDGDSRTSYTPPEFEMAIRNAGDYDLAGLSAKWHEMIWRARNTVKLLPSSELGKAVMTRDGKLFKGDDDALRTALSSGELVFHEGTIGGAWPRIIG